MLDSMLIEYWNAFVSIAQWLCTKDPNTIPGQGHNTFFKIEMLDSMLIETLECLCFNSSVVSVLWLCAKDPVSIPGQQQHTFFKIMMFDCILFKISVCLYFKSPVVSILWLWVKGPGSLPCQKYQLFKKCIKVSLSLSPTLDELPWNHVSCLVRV